MTSKPEHIPSLTPLRGIAALLVIIYHVDSLSRAQHLGRLIYHTGIIGRGYLWVDFFFVLSGFIMTHVYGDWFTNRIGRRAIRDFFAARFARIYPLYLFALGVQVLLYVGIFSHLPGMNRMYSLPTLPLHALMLLSFGLTPMGWNIPAWSIGAEWWTYLLTLPLFRQLNRGITAATLIVPALCATGLGLLVYKHPRQALDITFDFGLLRCLFDYTIGICAYQFYRDSRTARACATDRALVIATLLTAAVLHFAAPGDVPPGPFSFQPVSDPLTPLMDGLSPLAFAALIVCAACNRGRGERLLNARPLTYLGDISYSVYIMQGPGLTIFFMSTGIWRQQHPNGELGTPLLLGIAAVIVLVDLLIAAATYRWVETPSRRWLRRKLMR